MKHLLLHLSAVRNTVVGTEHSGPFSGAPSRLPLKSLGTWCRTWTLFLWKGEDKDQMVKLGWKHLWFPFIFKPLEDPGGIAQGQGFWPLMNGASVALEKGSPILWGCPRWLSEYQKGWRVISWALVLVECDFNQRWYYFSFMYNYLLLFFSVRRWGRAHLAQACTVGVCARGSTGVSYSRGVPFSWGP